MGIRKKVRTKWKAQRKIDEAKRRKNRAIRLKKTSQTNEAGFSI